MSYKLKLVIVLGGYQKKFANNRAAKKVTKAMDLLRAENESF